MKKTTRIIIQVILGIISIVLAFLLFESIMAPVRFEKERGIREKVVVQRLKDIRTAQLAHKTSFGKYINNIDSLILFLENGHLPMVKKIGNVPDTLTEAQALKLKIISRDTIYEIAYKVLFPTHTDKEKHLASLEYIPFTNKEEKITMSAGFIEKSGYKIPVFEVKMPYTSYLRGLDNQQIMNLASRANDLNRYPGIKVGSMEEAITEGNWE
ncbi:MAG: hypothetical protein RR328_03050 [Bacteroidales bacterium]